MHAGAVGTLIDVVTSFHLFCLDGHMMNNVTVSLIINTYKQVRIGQNVFILSKKVKKKSKLIFLECSIFDDEGVLCFDSLHVKSFVNVDKNQMKI